MPTAVIDSMQYIHQHIRRTLFKDGYFSGFSPLYKGNPLYVCMYVCMYVYICNYTYFWQNLSTFTVGMYA